MKKFLAIFLTLASLLSLSACNIKISTKDKDDAEVTDSEKEDKKEDKKETKDEKDEEKSSNADDDEEKDEDSEKKEDASISASKKVATAEPEFTQLSAGQTISLDFVEFTVAEMGIADDLQQEFTRSSGYSYKTGPESKADKEYVYIRGTIKNLATSTLDVRLKGNVAINGYNYDDIEISIYDSEGSWNYQIEPLVDYTYILYTEVPNTLAEAPETCIFDFGFDKEFSTDNLYSSNFKLKDFEYTYSAVIK